MKISELFNLGKFNDLVSDGYIKITSDDKTDLDLANYTPKTQFEQYWTPETLSSRGLIYNRNSLELVSRPMPKFFNLEEYPPEFIDLNSTVEVTDKKDGSCGIYYSTENSGPAIATRGSFQSDQALWATERIREVNPSFPDHITPIFEIIYEANRIVIKYDFEDLVLLCGVVKETGEILSCNDSNLSGWTGRKVEVFEYRTITEALSAPIRPQAEGYVFRFTEPSNDICLLKLKEKEYVRLHGIITNFSPKKVWAAMSEGIDFLKVLDTVPDEFYELVRQIQVELKMAYCIIEEAAKLDFHDLREFKTNRKKFAQEAVKKDNKSILFAMLDGKDYSKMIWKQLEPKEQNEA